jgi:HSP20 family protein
MNLTPWRRGETSLAFPDFEDFFKGMWGNGDTPVATHLPEVFHRRNFPAVNVAETEDSYAISLDCPGLEEEEIDVEVMGGMLVISGERKWEEEKQGKEFHRIESQFGKFERRIQMPANASPDSGKFEASYAKGVLTVLVPKSKKTPTSRIPVRATRAKSAKK